uniref:Uncharacterized protein n=1 Tax=Solanum tuberosum TaxID=4113 RepID=M1C8U7_SOLTU
MARQIVASLSSLQSAKARCSLSFSTALVSELQAISISSRRGEQQHLRRTATSARDSSDELSAKHQRTNSNDNNVPMRSSHLHSSHILRNSSSKTDLNRSVLATEEAQHVKKLIHDYFASFIKVGDKATEEAQHLKKLIQDYIASFIKVGDKVGASKFLKFRYNSFQ